MENNRTRELLYKLVGLTVSTLPVLVCALSFFPLWLRKGGAYVVSGFAVILCILALTPLMKYLKEALKSPAAYFLWLCSFLIFLFLSRIADEMTVISFVGFVSNLLGAVFFRLAKKYSK